MRAFYTWELEELAARRIVFNGGQTDITDRIEQLRAGAARHLAEEPSFGLLPARDGGIVTREDRDESALQTADGRGLGSRDFANTRTAHSGRHVHLVPYTGQKLTAEAWHISMRRGCIAGGSLRVFDL